MLIIIPIVSRRDVTKWLTRGRFGRQESRHWYYTGVFATGLHLLSNAVNAIIIKRTPGYGDVSIRDLTFFWCTRPRLAWLVVALLPYQAEKSMYFSATASILFGEVILQLFGAYNMGVAANYARRQKFMLVGHLEGDWYSKQAGMMYAGTILWLTAVPFAIVACVWSVLGVSERIGRLSEFWTLSHKVVKKNHAIASSQVKLLSTARDRMTASEERQHILEELKVSANIAVTKWQELRATWQRMPDELRQEAKHRRVLWKQEQKASEQLSRVREDSPKWVERSRALRIAQDNLKAANDAWCATPETKQEDARTNSANAGREIDVREGRKLELQALIATCNDRIPRLRSRIAVAKNWVESDAIRIKNVQSELKRRLRSSNRYTGIDEEIERLENDLSELLLQQETHKRELSLSIAENDPQLRLEESCLADASSMLDALNALSQSKSALVRNWQANENQWQVISEKRQEAEKKTDVTRFPIVVTVGMLLCWIAQWLWWSGYVGVAGDRYCPPKLAVIASVWTGFSATGEPHDNIVCDEFEADLMMQDQCLERLFKRGGWGGFGCRKI
jgi:hypothetical protein